jgi:hypothetical protein
MVWDFGELSGSATTFVPFILLECELRNFAIGLREINVIL